MRIREDRADVPGRPGRIWTSDKGGVGGVTDWIGAAEAAQRLGIKQASLYSYVSRGILKSYRQGTKRRRLYRRAEVEALRRLDRGAPPEIPPADSWIRD